MRLAYLGLTPQEPGIQDAERLLRKPWPHVGLTLVSQD